MGFLEVSHLTYALPDGRVLLDDVTFRVGEGQHAAMVGRNGAGKTTLLRVLAGDLTPKAGTVTAGGTVGVLHQLTGAAHAGATVRQLLLELAPARVRAAAADLAVAERALADRGDERAALRYATALTAWGDAGGYD